jgi:hypothetical protein
MKRPRFEPGPSKRTFLGIQVRLVILKITRSSKSGNRCFDSVEDRALGIPARIVSRPGIGIPGIGAAAERRRGLGFNIARLRGAVAANP